VISGNKKGGRPKGLPKKQNLLLVQQRHYMVKVNCLLWKLIIYDFPIHLAYTAIKISQSIIY